MLPSPDKGVPIIFDDGNMWGLGRPFRAGKIEDRLVPRALPWALDGSPLRGAHCRLALLSDLAAAKAKELDQGAYPTVSSKLTA